MHSLAVGGQQGMMPGDSFGGSGTPGGALGEQLSQMYVVNQGQGLGTVQPTMHVQNGEGDLLSF